MAPGPSVSRRVVLGGLAAVASGVASRSLGQAAGTVAVDDRISVITGLGGNVVVYKGAGSPVIVDSGARAHSQTLVAAVKEITATDTVGTLFNTHWHPEQIGANAALRARGAEIIAHAKTRAHLATPYYLPDEDRYRPAEPVDAQPTRQFHDSGVLELDDERVRFAYLLEAHTDGDICVQFENANVIVAGDAISPVRDPVIDWYGGGWLGGRIDSLEQLLAASDSTTRFVPAYGPVVDRRYVESEHAVMLGLFDILFERIRAGESAADIFAAGSVETLSRTFDDPMKLLYDTHKSMWAHYNTLSPDIV